MGPSLEEIAQTVAAGVRSASETIVATPASPTDDAMPVLDSQLAIGRKLGEGGMGLVTSARQIALSRSVAVKSIHPKHVSDQSRLQLVREARVTGFLEHPSIIPVHGLGTLENETVLVMKQVEGVRWRSLIAAASPQYRETDAYSRRQLSILNHVAEATSFAHSRGVLHRDIKPDNVMIGTFGEVYLMDWGIAVCFNDQLDGAPDVSEVHSIEGTIAYMAPEMVRGEGIGPHSDVYLLGACLHEVLVGAPPHAAETVPASLFLALESTPPEYGSSVPRELGDLARSAMAADATERPSAGAFASMLEEYLEHRDLILLCEEAESRCALAADPSTSREDARRLQHEARFAFDWILSRWPSSERAAEGRARLDHSKG